MPSTYTSSLKLELIANGEQETTWGETTNNNMGTLIEQAITGVQPITLTGDVELTNYNGISDQSRNAVLVFNGALANSANVVVPSVTKTYILSNRAGANVIVKTASGTGLTLANGVNTFVYCDGTNFTTAVDTSNIKGDLTVSGNQTVAGSITIGGNITLNNKVTSNTGTLSLTGSTGVVDMATNTGAFTPPYGSDAERPGTTELGMTRWNSTGGYMEIWNGVYWQNITGNYAVEYLIVAGGGGGGLTIGAGGGAGGLLSNATTVTVGTAYSVVVGSGGAVGTNGVNSSALSLTAIGGGAGNTGNAGGSGGGAGSGSPGVGTSGQGFAGGSAAGSYGGGGGGASAIGGNAVASTRGGNGGDGVQSSINGTATYYAGGAAGYLQGIGGTGGTAGNGSLNAGGGGDGYDPSAGKNGVVIIRYASASQRGTGGTVTSYSDAGITYFVHTFTTSGTYTA